MWRLTTIPPAPAGGYFFCQFSKSPKNPKKRFFRESFHFFGFKISDLIFRLPKNPAFLGVSAIFKKCVWYNGVNNAGKSPPLFYILNIDRVAVAFAMKGDCHG